MKASSTKRNPGANVLVIGNQKGGTAKTTSAAALAVLLSRKGQAVHIIDMDPQASLTAAFGQSEPEGLLYQALSRRGPLPVVRLDDYLTLTPSSIDLAKGESQFVSETAREYLLKSCLEQTNLPSGTVVIIDSPPSLGVLAVNCLAVASGLVVVVQPGGFELRALAHLEQVVELLKDRVNPGLAIVGAIITNSHSRRTITNQVRSEVKRLYADLGRIRSDSKLLYATTEGTILRIKASAAMEDYRGVLERLSEVCPWLK
jgi:chromosome partitioning protein